MRLFLASNLSTDHLEYYSSKLVELIGKNRRVLLISNARDHRTPELRKEIVDHDLRLLTICGLEVTELDLQTFFGKAEELGRYIKDYDPGCVFAMGGNMYSLATALRLSGMDKILLKDLKNDKYVYAGYSSGAMIASKDLYNFESSYGMRSGDRLEETKSIYGEVFTEGLDLIEEYICPHADGEKFREICKVAEADLIQKGLKPIILNDSDVVIVDDDGLNIYTTTKK
ncbi:Type 1 glutamine amidotransferase-like domain-containing protein [Candidatus Saccharibacteria bacterium]|nr:Type 1 glutamine amidotransferase-like domain-containing protein [Candidatus Saccharibacteria bacterium]